jgi:hypothetical protein
MFKIKTKTKAERQIASNYILLMYDSIGRWVDGKKGILVDREDVNR